MVKQEELPVLVWVDGTQAKPHWMLDRAEMLVGRDASNEIVIPVRQISRQHLRVLRRGSEYYIEDLRSKNGTWVNGIRLQGLQLLYDGDEIRIGKNILLLYVGSGATAPATAPLVREKTAPLYSANHRLQLNRVQRQVSFRGKLLVPPLSAAQFYLLEALYDKQGGVCQREEIVAAVWPDAIGVGVSQQAIGALVRRLRHRLQELDPEHQYIITRRGHGFRLDNPPDELSA